MRVETIPYSRLSRRFARFFVAWMEGGAAAEGFLPAGPFDRGALRAVAEARRREPFPRAALADALAARHRAMGSPPRVLEQIERLRDGGAFCVVAGQQPLLAGGPLFVAAKALTVLAVAREAEQGAGLPCVPLFWNHSDDHDIAEVDAFGLLDAARVEWTLRAGFPVDRRPVRDVGDEARMRRFRRELAERLPATPFTPAVLAALEETSAPGPAAWFTRLLTRWFGGAGLVVFEPHWVAREAAPLLSRALESAGGVGEAVDLGGKALTDAGFPRPLSEAGTGLFVHHEGARCRLEEDGGRFRWAGGPGDLSGAQVLDLLRARPDSFSPGAALRPVVQDFLLPSLATVAGPNEASYLAQLGPLYRRLGVTRPPVVPRAGVTVVGPEIARLIEASGTPFEAVLRGESIAPPLPAGLSVPFAEAKRAVEAALARLKEAAAPTGPGAERNFEKTRGRILESLDIYARKVAASAGRAAGGGVPPDEVMKACLAPGGRLQEQDLAGAWFLNQFGPDFFERLGAALDFRAGGHQVVVVE